MSQKSVQMLIHRIKRQKKNDDEPLAVNDIQIKQEPEEEQIQIKQEPEEVPVKQEPVCDILRLSTQQTTEDVQIKQEPELKFEAELLASDEVKGKAVPVGSSQNKVKTLPLEIPYKPFFAENDPKSESDTENDIESESDTETETNGPKPWRQSFKNTLKRRIKAVLVKHQKKKTITHPIVQHNPTSLENPTSVRQSFKEPQKRQIQAPLVKLQKKKAITGPVVKYIPVSLENPTKESPSPKIGSQETCILCLKEMKISLLRMHYKLHSEQSQYHASETVKCQLCHAQVLFKNIYYHGLSTECLGRRACPFCKMQLRDRKVLESHIFTNHRLHYCTLCNKVFSSKAKLDHHTVLHNVKKISAFIVCKACEMKVNVDEIRAHKDVCIKRRTCECCGEIFRKITVMFQHRQKDCKRIRTCILGSTKEKVRIEVIPNDHVPKLKTPEPPSKPEPRLMNRFVVQAKEENRLTCNQCTHVVKPTELLTHLSSNACLGRRVCYYCNEKLKSWAILKLHLHFNHGIFHCNACDIIVGPKEAWSNHLNQHKIQKRPRIPLLKQSPCPLCLQRTVVTGNLRAHLNSTHPNACKNPKDLYNCTFCNMKMNLSDMVSERHKETCLGKQLGFQRLVCKHCQAPFVDKEEYKLHLTLHVNGMVEVKN